MKLKPLFLLLFLMVSVGVTAQKEVIYKVIDTTQLSLKVFMPDTSINKGPFPTMIFFFGGGWNSGNIDQFKPHAEYFSKRNMVCVLSDYRVKKRHGTTPFESLEDAKSAVRFLRMHAAEYRIDTSKIVGAGGSAGGHLAAATALIEDYNEEGADKTYSYKPNALALFNPVIDNGPDGYGYARIGKEYAKFSPLHNIKAGAPPTIIFLGTNDHLIPVETAKKYKNLMEEVDVRCDLHLYDDQGHGFFNYPNFEYYKKTVEACDRFLQSLGYISKEAELSIE